MALATSVWAATWRAAVILYGIVNVGGVPGDLKAWGDVLQPLGSHVGRIMGVLLLLLIAVSVAPKEWRTAGTRWLKRLLPKGMESGVGERQRKRRRLTTDERRAAERAEQAQAQSTPPAWPPPQSF